MVPPSSYQQESGQFQSEGGCGQKFGFVVGPDYFVSAAEFIESFLTGRLVPRSLVLDVIDAATAAPAPGQKWQMPNTKVSLPGPPREKKTDFASIMRI